MGLHGVPEAAITEPGVRQELQHLRTLSLVNSLQSTVGPGDTGMVTTSTTSTGDDGMRQDRMKHRSVWLSHLRSDLQDI